MSGRRAPDDPAAVAAAVAACLAGWDAGAVPDRALQRVAVRGTLRALATAAPGRAVEVRVPPLAAVQCLPGPRHTRGTPPAVVETDPRTWLELATGRTAFSAAVAEGRVLASGARADLDAVLPVRAAAPLANGPGPGP